MSTFQFTDFECWVDEKSNPEKKQTASDTYRLSKDLCAHSSSVYVKQARN